MRKKGAARAPGHRAAVMHGSACTALGLDLFGLGYGTPNSPFGDGSCDMNEKNAQDALGSCRAVDILATHSPPKGVADRTARGASVGSVATRKTAQRLQPRYLLCGHVHNSWSVRGWIGHRAVVNPASHPIFLAISPGEVSRNEISPREVAPGGNAPHKVTQ